MISDLLAHGWREVAQRATRHRQFKHEAKSGRVTVPHPVKDLSPGTLASIRRQSGLRIGLPEKTKTKSASEAVTQTRQEKSIG